ncbi:PH domain-containing protein [Staphylococcus chromogenes]|nr:PH domain-containing protein [Staphylococcus chromogenes]
MSMPQLNPADPAYVKVRYLGELTRIAILAVAFAVAAVAFVPWLYIGTALCVAWLLWWLWLVPAQVKNLGWLETENELLLTKGKLWHTFTVVPYGRIQFVDVKAGPIERAFGLKHVELHTASSTSDSKVRGLKGDVADALRERLAEKARERMSGL